MQRIHAFAAASRWHVKLLLARLYTYCGHCFIKCEMLARVFVLRCTFITCWCVNKMVLLRNVNNLLWFATFHWLRLWFHRMHQQINVARALFRIKSWRFSNVLRTYLIPVLVNGRPIVLSVWLVDRLMDVGRFSYSFKVNVLRCRWISIFCVSGFLAFDLMEFWISVMIFEGFL